MAGGKLAMPEVLHVFEYLAYVIPGAVLLYAVLWLTPSLQAPLTEKNIDLGSFGIFVILAFVAGLLVHGIAHYVPEGPMRALGWVHRTDTLICSSQKLSGTEIRKAIGEKLKENMDDICASKDADAKRGVLREIFAVEQRSGTHHDRVELFEGRYYMTLDLAAVFIVLIPICAAIVWVTRPEATADKRPPVGKKIAGILAFLVGAAIVSLHLSSFFDNVYSHELVQSFLGV
jgi:hypothetical protein